MRCTLSLDAQRIITNVCKCALTPALPSTVAPKNVANGTPPKPHARPARSNSGFGIEAHAKIAQKPYLQPMAKMGKEISNEAE